MEREREIEAFNPVASYRVDAEFVTAQGNSFKAKLPKNFQTQEAARAFLEKNIDASYSVADLIKKPAKKSPAAPFTTSTLQQEAARKFISLLEKQ